MVRRRGRSSYLDEPGAFGFRQRAKNVVQRSDWRDRVPQAAVVGFEARTKRDAFHPMEVAASAAGSGLVRWCARQPVGDTADSFSDWHHRALAVEKAMVECEEQGIGKTREQKDSDT